MQKIISSQADVQIFHRERLRAMCEMCCVVVTHGPEFSFDFAILLIHKSDKVIHITSYMDFCRFLGIS